MINTRLITRACLVSAALAVVTLLPASPARGQDEFPLCAIPVAQNQAAASAQQPASSSSSQNSNTPGETQPEQKPEQKKDDRMFFVMPNFLTVQNEAEVKPLTWKGKFAITADGAFDPYEFAVAGVVSGIRQADNAYPGFGQGFVGYAKRYGTAMADQVDANMMVGAVFPSILRTDPRYFQLGKGSFSHRFGYALSRIFITRKDSGGSTFNFSEPIGNGVAIGISNLYYPASNRSVSSNLNGWGLQMAIDGFGNELKEFWPDIHRYLQKRHHASAARASGQ
ncbi:MAG TPA: hypothetical protein VHX36_05690 [Candidatus Acidoferrales bacterium]|nr:hypothetical protein [Candidatus Acidoferrales bacterium]